MPRREERERQVGERAAMQPALDCEACGALTSGARFRYFGDRLICAACDHQNTQTRVRSIPRELLAPARSVLISSRAPDTPSRQCTWTTAPCSVHA
jgi:hypothetical protein